MTKPPIVFPDTPDGVSDTGSDEHDVSQAAAEHRRGLDEHDAWCGKMGAIFGDTPAKKKGTDE